MQRILSWISVVLPFVAHVVDAAPAYAIYAARPEYPAEARTQHLTGAGAFVLHIRPDGTVERVETLKSIGHPILDRAAIGVLMVRCSSHCWSRHMSDWSCHTRSVQTMIHLKPSNQSMKPTSPPRNKSGVFTTTSCRGLSLSC